MSTPYFAATPDSVSPAVTSTVLLSMRVSACACVVPTNVVPANAAAPIATAAVNFLL